jgi:hypothetical protein
VVVICCEKNYLAVQEIFYRNSYFGIEEGCIKVVLDEKVVPLINSEGKLCISFELKTLSYPSGTARAVSVALHPSIMSFFQERKVEYLHFIGCDNLA